MLDLRRVLVVSLVAACLVSVTLVAAGPRNGEQPMRYNPRSLDGPLANLTSPLDGTVWSAWSYRNGAEYDIAVSFREAGGFWSEPAFLGRDDAADQVQPAMTIDAAGNLYLAYVNLETGAVELVARAAGARSWSAATTITAEGERGFMPAVSVVGDRLVVAFRSGRGIAIRDLALLPPAPVRGYSIQDNPDPYGREDDDDGSAKPSGG